jgi:hypothetical protein
MNIYIEGSGHFQMPFKKKKKVTSKYWDRFGWEKNDIKNDDSFKFK